MRHMYWTEPSQLADENLETVLSVPLFYERHCLLPALSPVWTGQMRGAASVYSDPSSKGSVYQRESNVLKSRTFSFLQYPISKCNILI